MIILSSQRANWPARMYTSRKMCKYGGLNALVPAAIYARKEVGGGGWVGWGLYGWGVYGCGALSMPSQNRFSIHSVSIWSVLTLDTS